MGLLGRFRRKEERAVPAGFAPEAVADSILHPSSFSLVVFHDDHAGQVPALLAACGYTVLHTGHVHGNPVQLHDALGEVRDGSIVTKAYWSCPTMTVLIDPEMIVSSASEEQLAAFCRDQETKAVCAVWERVSEPAMLIEIDAAGVRRKTWHERGAHVEASDPRPEVAASPDDAGLKAGLAATGIDTDLLFSEAEATVVELQE